MTARSHGVALDYEMLLQLLTHLSYCIHVRTLHDEFHISSTYFGQGRSDGGYIGVYTPPPQKKVYLKFFMWLFCLLDPGQIRYRAIYTHPNQIPGYASDFGLFAVILVQLVQLVLCIQLQKCQASANILCGRPQST